MATHYLRFGDSGYYLSFVTEDGQANARVVGVMPESGSRDTAMSVDDARKLWTDLLTKGWRQSGPSSYEEGGLPLAPRDNDDDTVPSETTAKPPFQGRVVRNDRNGRSLTTTMSDADACKAFAEHYSRDQGHWLWYWVHEYVSRIPRQQPQQQQQQNGKLPGNAIAGDGYNAMTFLGDCFMVAIGYGLKRPRIRLKFKDRRYKIYLSKRGTVCFKSGELVPLKADASGKAIEWSNDPMGDEQYIGCLSNGQWLPPSRNDNSGEWRWSNPGRRELTESEREFISNLFSDPIAFMSQCSKDMGQCCYCGHQLDDPTSKRLGYGPICARHYGLPWGDKAYTEKAPSFARSYDDDARNITRALRSTNDESERALLWMQFSDWLTDKGLPPCKQPERRVVLPRA